MSSARAYAEVEAADRFRCFGGHCSVLITGPRLDAERAVAESRSQLLAWHDCFTRFTATSELSRLNADPRETVPVSPSMALFLTVAADAARLTGGLVDPTLAGAIEAAGYRTDLAASLPLPLALRMAPERRPAGPHPAAAWRALEVSIARRSVTRPPGVRVDSGGIAKGLFADMLSERLTDFDAFAIDCAGDLRVGGTPRLVNVASPFDERVIHTFEVADAGVATSGIGRRSWLGLDGRPAHHLLDPATLRPAFTGIVQATAIAPTAVLAEVRAKAALLSGPEAAEQWLPDGGVLVFDDGSVAVSD